VTRETAASSAGPGQAGPNGHAPASRPARPAPLQSRTMAHDRPRPDENSRRIIDRANRPNAPAADNGPAGSPGPAHARDTAGTAPWRPPCQAPDEIAQRWPHWRRRTLRWRHISIHNDQGLARHLACQVGD